MNISDGCKLYVYLNPSDSSPFSSVSVCICFYVSGCFSAVLKSTIQKAVELTACFTPCITEVMSPVHSLLHFDLWQFYSAAVIHYCPWVYSVIDSILLRIWRSLPFCFSAAFLEAYCPLSLACVQFLWGSLLMKQKASNTSDRQYVIWKKKIIAN